MAIYSAPFFKEDTDVIGCWLNWSVASGGYRPWAIYAANADCNYPPFVLYLLCASQFLITLLHAQQTGPLAILIVKLPNLIACLAGAWVCFAGVKPLAGRKSAELVALIYILCIPLWFNAAIWGQWDALSSLAMIAALLAVANGRPFWAGAAIGWAFSIKLHVIVIIPAICVFLVRRWSMSNIAKAAFTALCAWALICAPFFIAGQQKPVFKSYTGAINFYPGLTEGAFNGWQLVNYYNLVVRHEPLADAGFDGQRIVGPITCRELGLLLFAGYTAWLCLGLARYPTRRNLIATAGMAAVAFFMLPTQVHQRYLVPAAAIFAIVFAAGYGKPYFLVMVAALLYQWVVIVYESRLESHGVNEMDRDTFMKIYCLFSVLNLIGFLWITWQHHRRLADRESFDALVPNS